MLWETCTGSERLFGRRNPHVEGRGALRHRQGQAGRRSREEPCMSFLHDLGNVPCRTMWLWITGVWREEHDFGATRNRFDCAHVCL